MSSVLRFTVYGRPRAQGSKRHVGNGIMVEQGKHIASWRGAISDAAARTEGAQIMEGPVSATVRLCFARPKGHYGSGRNASALKPGAPAHPTSHSLGDIDKMLRAAFDGITGILIRDDSQIVAVTAQKVYSEPERMEIVLEETEAGRHDMKPGDPLLAETA